MRRIEAIATVENGTLTIPVPPDVTPGAHPVIVEIDERPTSPPPKDWSAFIDQTAGAWHGDVERPAQGEFEQRDSF